MQNTAGQDQVPPLTQTQVESITPPLNRYFLSTFNLKILIHNFFQHFQISPLVSESTLFVTHVTSADYGTYECVARNELGFTTITLRLDVTSAPDTPTLLKVLNVTHDTVTLGWTPGFDGGMTASYRIRYRQVNTEAYKYEDVVPHNVTHHTVTGLEPNVQYLFSIMASNKLGNSKYMPDLVTARTTSEYTDLIFQLDSLHACLV